MKSISIFLFCSCTLSGLLLIGHQGRPYSGERQLAVSGQTLDHMAIGADPITSASHQMKSIFVFLFCRCTLSGLLLVGHGGRPYIGERQGAVSGNTLDHTAIRAGPIISARWSQSLSFYSAPALCPAYCWLAVNIISTGSAIFPPRRTTVLLPTLFSPTQSLHNK